MVLLSFGKGVQVGQSHGTLMILAVLAEFKRTGAVGFGRKVWLIMRSSLVVV